MKALNLSTGQSFATTDLVKGMGMFKILETKDIAEFETKKKNERKYKGEKKTEKLKKSMRKIYFQKKICIHEPSADSSFPELPNTFTAP